MTRLHCPFCGRSIGTLHPSNRAPGGEQRWREYLTYAHSLECKNFDQLPVTEEPK